MPWSRSSDTAVLPGHATAVSANCGRQGKPPGARVRRAKRSNAWPITSTGSASSHCVTWSFTVPAPRRTRPRCQRKAAHPPPGRAHHAPTRRAAGPGRSSSTAAPPRDSNVRDASEESITPRAAGCAPAARDNGIQAPAAYRYPHEGLTVPADHAPDQSTAPKRTAVAGYTHLNLDGTVVRTDRVSAAGSPPRERPARHPHPVKKAQERRTHRRARDVQHRPPLHPRSRGTRQRPAQGDPSTRA